MRENKPSERDMSMSESQRESDNERQSVRERDKSMNESQRDNGLEGVRGRERAISRVSRGIMRDSE